jgi:hypothetical protein
MANVRFYKSSKQLLFEIESSGINVDSIDDQWNRQFDLKDFFKCRLFQIKDQKPWNDDQNFTNPNLSKEQLFEVVARSLTFNPNPNPESDLYCEQLRREEKKKVDNLSKNSQNQKPKKIFNVGDVVDFCIGGGRMEIGCRIIRNDLDGKYDIKDRQGVVKQSVPQSEIRPTLLDFYTIESLHCMFQEFLSERDFTWKLLYNCVLLDKFRQTIDK